MEFVRFILVTGLLSKVLSKGNTPYDYINQTSWAGNCKGNQQSPINLEVSNGICEKNIVFNVEVSNTQMNFKAEHMTNTVGANGKFTHLTATNIGGKVMSFDAESFHFHAKSEHTINKKFYDLELHIVHHIKPEYTHLTKRHKAVLGIMFNSKAGAADNPLLSAVIETINNKTSKAVTPKALFPFIKPVSPFYMYEGSLTTPNCDEVVNWYVVEQPVDVNPNQLLFLTSKWKGNTTFANGTVGNNRNIQNLNSRVIKKGGYVCEEKFVYFFSFLILYIFINYFIFKLL